MLFLVNKMRVTVNVKAACIDPKAVKKRRQEMKIFTKTAAQTSESMVTGMLLAASGGYMDAYSYLCREHVFANAQTGNMLLFGIYVSERSWNLAFRYLLPVLAFTAGIALADGIRIFYQRNRQLHWRQAAVLLEAGILVLVGFIPEGLSLAANGLTSFACGIQVESFRKIHGNGIATTMCIGNLRSATQYMCEYFHTQNTDSVKRGLLYYGIILSFMLGAILGNLGVQRMQERAILLCPGFLLLVFVLMFSDREKRMLPV